MKKYFYVADKKSNKYIVKANVNNGLFNDNATIAHCCLNKTGFKIYLHERANALHDARAIENPSYTKLEKEKFSRKFDYTIDALENAKTEKQIEKAYKDALKVIIDEFNASANELANELAKNEPA